MNDLILGTLGLGNIDLDSIRDSGVNMLMSKYHFNIRQAIIIERSAFNDCGGNLIRYASYLTDLGDLLNLLKDKARREKKLNEINQ